jgi:hypothetical protein
MSLTVGYLRVLKASDDITEHDLRSARHNPDVEAKLDENPLQYVLLNLVDLVEADSEESQERERKKSKAAPSEHVGGSHSPAYLISEERPTTPQMGQSRIPTSFECTSFERTPNNKRKVSETSFGTRSTETTPAKLDHPEAKVQSLQDTFVHTIIAKVWWGRVDITWAQGRRLFLTYTEFVPLPFNADDQDK